MSMSTNLGVDFNAVKNLGVDIGGVTIVTSSSENTQSNTTTVSSKNSIVYTLNTSSSDAHIRSKRRDHWSCWQKVFLCGGVAGLLTITGGASLVILKITGILASSNILYTIAGFLLSGNPWSITLISVLALLTLLFCLLSRYSSKRADYFDIYYQPVDYKSNEPCKIESVSSDSGVKLEIDGYKKIKL